MFLRDASCQNEKGTDSRPATDLQADGGTDDHALPQVADADHEAQAVVAHGDDGVAAEDERLGAPVRLRRLHEDATYRKSGRGHALVCDVVIVVSRQHKSQRGARSMLSGRPSAGQTASTQHDGVDDEAHDVLQDEHRDGGGTLLGDHAPAETDGHLHLDGEQEGRREGPGKDGNVFAVMYAPKKKKKNILACRAVLLCFILMGIF